MFYPLERLADYIETALHWHRQGCLYQTLKERIFAPYQVPAIFLGSLFLFALAIPLMPPSIDDAQQVLYATQGYHSFGERGDVRFQGPGFFWILRILYRMGARSIVAFRAPGIVAAILAFFMFPRFCEKEYQWLHPFCLWALLPWIPLYFIKLHRLRADGYILLILAIELEWIIHPGYHPDCWSWPDGQFGGWYPAPTRTEKSIVAFIMGLLAGLSVWIYPSGLCVCLIIFPFTLWNLRVQKQPLEFGERPFMHLHPCPRWLWWVLGCGLGLCFAMNQLDSRFWESVVLNRYYWGAKSQAPAHLWTRVFYPSLIIPVLLLWICRDFQRYGTALISIALLAGTIQTARLIRFYRAHDLYFDDRFRRGYARQKSYVGPLNLWWIDPKVRLTDSALMDCDTTNMIPKVRHDL